MKEPIKEEIKQSCLEFAKDPKTYGLLWKDKTTHSRDSKEKIPTNFVVDVGGLHISIVVGHIYYPNQWVMNCYGLDIKERVLKCSTAKSAAIAAIAICHEKVSKMHNSLSELFKNETNG